MINADQARQQVLDSVFKRIEARAKEGRYSLCLDVDSMNYQEIFFKKLAYEYGFDVFVTHIGSSYKITISWHEGKDGDFFLHEEDWDPWG